MSVTEYPTFNQSVSRDDEISPVRSEVQSSSSSAISSPTESVQAFRAPRRAPLSTSTSQASFSRQFRSRLVVDPVPKPWLDRKSKSRNWDRILPWSATAIGIIICGLLLWDGYRTINKHKYCLVFEDDFSGSQLDLDKWAYDVEVGGFGNGEFEWTTAEVSNTFLENGNLNIKPTMTSTVLSEGQILSGYTVNLTMDGTCSSTDPYACIRSSNETTKQVISPVRSARIHTKGKGQIKYGRVEVTARLPKGDWLWPAIWMLPVEETYGMWPRSGEIDIMESRGNGIEYEAGGSDTVGSAMHWGPNSDMDAYYKTNGRLQPQRTDFASDFHTYGLEWTEDYMFMYVDNKLVQVSYTKFDQYFWKRGNFPAKDGNNTVLSDIWSQTGHKSAPFDQSFYLIINLAVGGTNGWFPDVVGNKPWVNQAPTAMQDFNAARDTWSKTWSEKSNFQVSGVKMWQQCD